MAITKHHASTKRGGLGIELPTRVQEVMRSNLGREDNSRCLYCFLYIYLHHERMSAVNYTRHADISLPIYFWNIHIQIGDF